MRDPESTPPRKLPPALRIEAILFELECPEGWCPFLNRRTGQVVSLPEDSDFDTEDMEVSWEDIEESPDWIALPDREEIDEYGRMVRFADETLAGAARGEVLTALDGRGAFRMFRATIARLEHTDAWYAFRDESLRALVLDWLEDHGLTLE